MANPPPENDVRRQLLQELLTANNLTPEQFVSLLVHPFAQAIADKIWVSPDNEQLALDAAVMEKVERGLGELAGKGNEFFVAYQQVTNLTFALAKSFPNSVAPAVLLEMLDRVAAVALPKLAQEEVQASQELVTKVGDKFREFVGKGEGKQLPDTGERMDIKKLPRNIKG